MAKPRHEGPVYRAATKEELEEKLRDAGLRPDSERGWAAWFRRRGVEGPDDPGLVICCTLVEEDGEWIARTIYQEPDWGED